MPKLYFEELVYKSFLYNDANPNLHIYHIHISQIHQRLLTLNAYVSNNSKYPKILRGFGQTTKFHGEPMSSLSITPMYRSQLE